MFTIRISTILIGLLLVLSANTIAQKSPLVITGSVVEVNPKAERFYKNGKIQTLETYFEIKLRLQYHNRGDTTLIIPTPNAFDGRKKLFFYDIPSTDSKVTATSDQWMFPESYDRTSSLLRELAGAEPSRYYFVVVEPGGYYETMTTFGAISGYKLEKRPSGAKFPPEIEFAIPEHPYFKIRYSLSIKDRPESSEPLADAARRWNRFGKLMLNSDGDFFFETEVIINKLPD